MATMLYVGNGIVLYSVSDYAMRKIRWPWEMRKEIRNFIEIYASPPMGLLKIQTAYPEREHALYYWILQMLLYGSIAVAFYLFIDYYYRTWRYNDTKS